MIIYCIAFIHFEHEVDLFKVHRTVLFSKQIFVYLNEIIKGKWIFWSEDVEDGKEEDHGGGLWM